MSLNRLELRRWWEAEGLDKVFFGGFSGVARKSLFCGVIPFWEDGLVDLTWVST
jgi:hypothetical protein